jgi:hypothetical protein
MVKKIFALVMVIGVLGAVLGGCSSEEKPAETPAAGTDAKTP